MKRISKLLIALLVLSNSTHTWASTTRALSADSITNTIGGASLSVPSIGASFVSDSSTVTLSNKTISGSSNTFSNIPASAVSSGQLGVANGGTGAATLTQDGILKGNGTGAVTAITGSQYQSLQYGSSGVPVAGAVNLNQSAAVTGALGVSNGGTGSSSLTSGSVVVGNGTSAVSLVAPGSSGNVLTSNGSTWTSSAPAASGGSTHVVGSVGSPQSISAGTAIAVTGQVTNGPNLVFVAGNAGAVTVTATPSITACSAAGEQLMLIGTDDTNTVTIQDEAGLSGSKLQLNGNAVLGLNSSISFLCDAASGNWVEIARR